MTTISSLVQSLFCSADLVYESCTTEMRANAFGIIWWRFLVEFYPSPPHIARTVDPSNLEQDQI